MIELTIESGVRVMRMTHGKANALDVEFCEALARAFEQEATEPAPLVLTGAGRIFSAGVDLPRVVNEGEAYIPAFLRALDDCFLHLFSLEKPVVAAINGHAIAGGCILAAACDMAVMVNSGATIGAPELAVGVPFPPLPLEILRHAVGTHSAQWLALSTENVGPEKAQQLGLVHRLTTSEQLLTEAVAEAARLGAMPRRSFELVKRQLRAPAFQQLEALRGHSEAVASEWQSAAVRTAIRRFVEATFRPRS